MTPKSIGVTASKYSICGRQYGAAKKMLDELGARELHHGDCIGGDAVMHDLALTLGMSITIHPPDNDRYRAWCKGAMTIKPCRPYLTRNADIVRDSDLLVALPNNFHEVLRSGVWATVRYARKAKKPVVIIWPDGHIATERV